MAVDYNQNSFEFIKASNLNLNKKSFIEFYGKKIGYERIFELVDNCAENMARFGIGKGTVVTLALPNCPQFIIAVYALCKLGAICSMVSPLTSVEATVKTMTKTGSKIIVISDLSKAVYEQVKVLRVHFGYFMPFIKKIVLSVKNKNDGGFAFESLLKKVEAPFVSTSSDDPSAPAFYLHSGGTTGEPKTVVLSQKALNYCALTITDNLNDNNLTCNDDITCAYILPLFYGYGLGVLHTQMYNGYSNVVRAKFDPESLASDFAKHKIGLMFGVPVMYAKLLKTGKWSEEFFNSLKLCYIGGEKLTGDLKKSFKAAFPNAAIIEGYGMTEAVTAFVAGSLKGVKDNSCGKVGNFIKIEVFDEAGNMLPRGTEGELCIETKAAMIGYLNDSETTDKTIFEYSGEKWLRSGDYGVVDEEAFVFLVQRIKNIIKRKGVNIFPIQVEASIKQLDFIKSVAVFGCKDKEDIERIVCAATLNTKVDNAEELIKDQVKKQISIVSTPEYVMILDEMPYTNVGKINVLSLKKIASEKWFN